VRQAKLVVTYRLNSDMGNA